MIVAGIISGDHECWCLLVDKDTFKRAKGKEPEEEFDVGPFSKKGCPYRYKLYPSDLLREFLPEKKGQLTGSRFDDRVVVVTMEAEELVGLKAPAACRKPKVWKRK